MRPLSPVPVGQKLHQPGTAPLLGLLLQCALSASCDRIEQVAMAPSLRGHGKPLSVGHAELDRSLQGRTSQFCLHMDGVEPLPAA